MQRRSGENIVLSLSLGERLIFKCLMLGSPVLFFVLLEIGLRIADYGEDLRLFVSTPDETSRYYGMNLRVARRYYYYYGEEFDPKPLKDLFLKEKPENGYRIFVLGASTTAGFPYGNNVSFPRFLHRRLVNTFPDRHIEVINTAITSVNSYTLLDFMDEILEQQPDALLIYAGHNEYYGPFGPAGRVPGKRPWAVKTVLRLQRFKTFILLRNMLGSNLRKWMNQIVVDESSPDSTLTIDPQFIEKTMIPYDSHEYQLGIDQFQGNFHDILDKAKDTGISVLMSEIISNIRGQKPFPTTEADTLSMADQAFNKARMLEMAGRYDEARTAYYKAKDLDPVRFRAPEEFNEIIHNLGEEFGVPVVPMKSYFEIASPNGLIGNNIILEHVHPDFEGYFIMADAFYNTMRDKKFISDKWPEPSYKTTSSYIENWGYTSLDSLYAALVVLKLTSGWPFTTESVTTVSGPNTVLDRFIPKTKMDSIAIAANKNPNYSLQLGHLDLARYYEGKGEFERALDEYLALIYSIPSLDIFYEPAVKLLMRMKQYERAYQLLDEALKHHKSAFIYKWLGQISLILSRMKDGISSLNQARVLDPADTQVLHNLARAYFYISEFNKGNEILAAWAKLSPNDPAIEKLNAYRELLETKLAKVSEYLNEARMSIGAKQYKQALGVLQRSVQIHETALTNELMGVVMMQSRNAKQAVTYFERARQMKIKEKPGLMYNLSLAYLENAQYQKAIKSFVLLKKASPYFPDLDKLEYLIGKAVPKK